MSHHTFQVNPTVNLKKDKLFGSIFHQIQTCCSINVKNLFQNVGIEINSLWSVTKIDKMMYITLCMYLYLFVLFLGKNLVQNHLMAGHMKHSIMVTCCSSLPPIYIYIYLSLSLSLYIYIYIYIIYIYIYCIYIYIFSERYSVVAGSNPTQANFL